MLFLKPRKAPRSCFLPGWKALGSGAWLCSSGKGNCRAGILLRGGIMGGGKPHPGGDKGELGGGSGSSLPSASPSLCSRWETKQRLCQVLFPRGLIPGGAGLVWASQNIPSWRRIQLLSSGSFLQDGEWSSPGSKPFLQSPRCLQELPPPLCCSLCYK